MKLIQLLDVLTRTFSLENYTINVRCLSKLWWVTTEKKVNVNLRQLDVYWNIIINLLFIKRLNQSICNTKKVPLLIWVAGLLVYREYILDSIFHFRENQVLGIETCIWTFSVIQRLHKPEDAGVVVYKFEIWIRCDSVEEFEDVVLIWNSWILFILASNLSTGRDESWRYAGRICSPSCLLSICGWCPEIWIPMLSRTVIANRMRHRWWCLVFVS